MSPHSAGQCGTIEFSGGLKEDRGTHQMNKEGPKKKYGLFDGENGKEGKMIISPSLCASLMFIP